MSKKNPLPRFGTPLTRPSDYFPRRKAQVPNQIRSETHFTPERATVCENPLRRGTSFQAFSSPPRKQTLKLCSSWRTVGGLSGKGLARFSNLSHVFYKIDFFRPGTTSLADSMHEWHALGYHRYHNPCCKSCAGPDTILGESSARALIAMAAISDTKISHRSDSLELGAG